MRKIIHVDMDAFYASVEQRDAPELRGRPVAVGGTSLRGVVAAASYEARRFGVRSAMPSARAARLCPDLIFVRPRFDVYRIVSQQIREIFHGYTDLVEPLSLDEAYLDVTEPLKGPPSATLIAEAIRAEIREVTGLTASAGVSYNKFLAKTASAMNKPDGLTVVLPEQAEAFMAALPIERFYGVGHVTAARMRERGIETGADLLAWSEADLGSIFGRAGRYYYRIVRGIDDREVHPHRARKSIGGEQTFERDVHEPEELDARLVAVARRVGERMERSEAAGRTVTLKIKYHDFAITTRSRTLSHDVHTVDELLAIGRELLQQPTPPLRPVRLMGLTVSNLTGETPPQLELELR
ncbi:MAG TPA: DNA polymerase IV [Candidatus Kapabacteria bacterium]|jgi:DNA polymerase-4|nr:DNA polymerase IV [Candidatus Kapabacteria bacterium]